jgi:hypothetical protein
MPLGNPIDEMQQMPATSGYQWNFLQFGFFIYVHI